MFFWPRIPSMLHVVKDCLPPLCMLTLAIPFATTLLFQESPDERQAIIRVSGFEARQHASQKAPLAGSGCTGQSDNEAGAGNYSRSVENIFGKQASTQCLNDLTTDGQTKTRMLPEILRLGPL